MPIYAYQCSACGHAEDVLQRMSDAPLIACPACGKDTYVKQVTAAGFQLKGSGWYVTDFRDSGSKSGKSSHSDKGESAGATDQAKPEQGAQANTATATPAASDASATSSVTASSAPPPAAPSA